MPHNPFTGSNYHGINVLLLWAGGLQYDSNAWATYKQVQGAGGQVRRGEKGHHVIFYKTLNIKERDETGEETEKRIPLMRGFTVFNVEQCDGIELPKPKAIPHAEKLAHAETYIANIGATVRHGGNGAYFNVGKDFIQLPHAGYFRDIESYYAASLHEHTHWTGHKSRLDRKDAVTRYGTEAYAFEELVAEMGSAFACANLGITRILRATRAI